MARKPKLLADRDLPAGFVYPHDFLAAVGQHDLGAWEWLQGYRLRGAAQRLWENHTRSLVPFALRTGTEFMVCFHADRPVEGGGYEVMTLDSGDERAEPVQHTPDFRSWWEGAQAERRPQAPPPPVSTEAGGEPVPDLAATGHEEPEDRTGQALGWIPPTTGSCGCVHHLDAFAAEVVPYGKSAPQGLPARRVADLVMEHDLAAEPAYPGPELSWRNRPVGPFHWQVFVGQPARLHLDEDGRVPLETWLMGNPGVDLAVWPEKGDLLLAAPHLCRDGVLTVVARALLDDRVR
ncbi:MAG: hypothetical protein WB471_09100, partial [Nocardioides sp.]